jgi:hypothetical protein
LDNSNYIKIGASVLGAIIIGLVVYFMLPENLPSLSFYNGDSLVTNGDVSIDGEYIGSLDENGIIKIPKGYCQDKHTVKLSSGKEYELDFYPEDCKYKVIKYSLIDSMQTIEKNT